MKILPIYDECTCPLSHLDEATFILRGIRSDFKYFIFFFMKFFVNKKNSPRWDATFCGTSWAILFAYAPYICNAQKESRFPKGCIFITRNIVDMQDLNRIILGVDPDCEN